MDATFTHKGSYSHVPGYAEINFQQGLDGDGWELVAQPWGRLVYHRAGEFATVPNIHYNQPAAWRIDALRRSEEHTSELQSLMRLSYAVFCLKKKKNIHKEREK